MSIEEIVVSYREAYQRIDHYLMKKGVRISRTYLQRLIKDGLITVNNISVKSNYNIKPDDNICIAIPPPDRIDVQSEEIPLNIVYEDDSLIVINKPAGMVVHPAYGNRSGTLVNALLAYCKDLSGIGGRERPGIVHRLDKETSGLIVAAKTDLAHNFLSDSFKNKTVDKRYIALVWGEVKRNKEKIELPIGRDIWDRKKISQRTFKPKEAITYIKVIRRFDGATLIQAIPKTGRTHQIRVHLASIGHPIIGDKFYSGRKKINLEDISVERHMLHAMSIGFIHPSTKKYVEFDSILPDDMQRLIDRL
ncbi:MAG: RluA family pseudouridine synthase [Nitrospirota bacterium]